MRVPFGIWDLPPSKGWASEAHVPIQHVSTDPVQKMYECGMYRDHETTTHNIDQYQVKIFGGFRA